MMTARIGDGIKEFVETVPKPLINRLRKIVAPPGKKGTWMRHLSDAQLAEIYFRLRAGQACYAMAKMAQEQWGVMTQSHVQSLARSVRQFRDKSLGDLQIAKITGDDKDTSQNKKVAKILDRKTKDLVERCDGLNVMAWGILCQQERIAVMMQYEHEVGYVSKQTDTAMKVLSDMTDKYIKAQIELGVMGIAPTPGDVHFHAHIKGMVGSMSGTEREKMADVANRFVELIQSKSIKLIQDDDGQWRYGKAADTEMKNVSNECVPINNRGD
jgi:hypothetical protein